MPMHSLFALSSAFALDQLRRASTLVLAVVGVLMILSLRYFSAFGLGYEVVQLKEMAVYTIGLLCVVATFLFALPRDDEPAEGAEIQLLTRPVGPGIVSLGAFCGRLVCLAALCALWTLTVYAAMWWFQLGEPQIFGYRGATSATEEASAVIAPVLAQFLTGAMLLALVQPLARTRKPVIVAAGLALIYVAGFSAGGLGDPWARILPDFARHDITAGLWGRDGRGLSVALAAHALGWCAVGLAIDSGILRARVAS